MNLKDVAKRLVGVVEECVNDRRGIKWNTLDTDVLDELRTDLEDCFVLELGGTVAPDKPPLVLVPKAVLGEQVYVERYRRPFNIIGQRVVYTVQGVAPYSVGTMDVSENSIEVRTPDDEFQAVRHALGLKLGEAQELGTTEVTVDAHDFKMFMDKLEELERNAR